MKLVFIYGAPGVGKLTTAQALAALTGFRLFHNHLSFNLVQSVFDFPTQPFGELAVTIRLRLSCDPATNERRVVAEERRALGKIASVESLRGVLARWNLTSAMAGRDSLEVDNSALTADAAARRIAAHFSLPISGEARGGVRS